MAFYNVIAVGIVISMAVTVKLHGITNIQPSSQAAEALPSMAGNFAFAVFALDSSSSLAIGDRD